MNDDRWLLELDGRERAEGLEAELAGMRLEMQRLRELLSKKDAMIAQLLPAPQEVASGSSAASVLTPPNSTPDSFATEAGPPVLRQLSINASGEFPSIPPPDSQPADRRSRPRRAYEQRVEFVAESHFFAGLTQDICSGGLFVATYQLLPIGKKLGIKLELPDGSELEAEGVVRWIRSAATHESELPGIGIAFTNLSPESAQRISAFCQQRPPLYMEL